MSRGKIVKLERGQKKVIVGTGSVLLGLGLTVGLTRTTEVQMDSNKGQKVGF